MFIELRKIILLKFRYYFRSTWNFIDVTVISMVYATSAVNLYFTDVIFRYSSATRVMHSITIILIYLRLLSYIRAFSGLSFMIRMLLQSTLDIRYFLMILVLVIVSFTLSSNYIFYII